LFRMMITGLLLLMAFLELILSIAIAKN
jgi:hypothetical protein